MKKLLLPIMLIAGLALSGSTTMAVAGTESATTVTTVESITANPSAVLLVSEPSVTTVAAPLQPVTPDVEAAPVTEPSPTPVPVTEPTPATPTETAPTVAPATGTTAETAPDCTNLKLGDAWAGVGLACGLGGQTAAPVTVAPVTESYPAPLPSSVCMEDQPCWNCATMGNGICGNPACDAVNLFTVTVSGECGRYPFGFSEEDAKADSVLVAAAAGVTRSYIASQFSRFERPGFIYLPATIPGMVHVFG